jgi:N-acetylneuraminate lyase
MLLGALATGARAAIGSTYNVAAPLYRRLIDAFASGRLSEARDLQLHSIAMINTMKKFSFHASLKAMLEMLGMPGGSVRLPLVAMSVQEIDQLRQQLESIGFFDWCGHCDRP